MGVVVVLVIVFFGVVIIVLVVQVDMVFIDFVLLVIVSVDLFLMMQINGIVWVQVVGGNKVYVGGQFMSVCFVGVVVGMNEML